MPDSFQTAAWSDAKQDFLYVLAKGPLLSSFLLSFSLSLFSPPFSVLSINKTIFVYRSPSMGRRNGWMGWNTFMQWYYYYYYLCDLHDFNNPFPFLPSSSPFPYVYTIDCSFGWWLLYIEHSLLYTPSFPLLA